MSTLRLFVVDIVGLVAWHAREHGGGPPRKAYMKGWRVRRAISRAMWKLSGYDSEWGNPCDECEDFATFVGVGGGDPYMTLRCAAHRTNDASEAECAFWL